MSENIITNSAAGFLVTAGFSSESSSTLIASPLKSQDLLSKHENSDSVVLTGGWGNLIRRGGQKSLKIGVTVSLQESQFIKAQLHSVFLSAMVIG